MKSKIIVCAITAATLGFGSLSFAQGYDRGGRDNGPQRYDQRGPQQRVDNDRRDDNGPRGFDNHRDARNDRADRRNPYYANARGPEFRRGGHIPQQYRSRQYVVNDWRGHHLNAPPRGQQWVQVGSDYALVAIATGVIASLILNQ